MEYRTSKTVINVLADVDKWCLRDNFVDHDIRPGIWIITI